MMKMQWTWRRSLLGLALAGVVGQCLAMSLAGAEEGVLLAPPVLDETPKTGSETAVFAGGCFWGVQGVFQHINGVDNAVSGYIGGSAGDASYTRVGSGGTGHAEAVKVTYDPSKVSYGQLMQVFFSVAHDPTQLNRQGPDRGTQYRSVIFYHDAEQKEKALAYKAKLTEEHVWENPIVTEISRPFGAV